MGISRLCILLLCLCGVSMREQYSGLRLTTNNKFVESTTQVIMNKGFQYLHSLVKPPNNFSIGLDFWLLFFNIELYNFTSVSQVLNETSGAIKIYPDSLISINLPVIKAWNIKFLYKYASAFAAEKNGSGSLDLKDVVVKLSVRIPEKDTINIEDLTLDLGSSKLTIQSSSALLSLLQWVFNNLTPVVAWTLNKMVPWAVNTFYPKLNLILEIQDKYNLDMNFFKKIETEKGAMVANLLLEVFNSDIGRVDVPAPFRVDNLPVDYAKPIEVAVNSFAVTTLLESMNKKKDLYIELTDEIVHKATGVIHLKGRDFMNYFPEAEKYKDRNLTLLVQFDKDTQMTLTETDIYLTGKTKLDFAVEKSKEVLAKLLAETEFGLKIKTEGKKITLSLTKIYIKDLTCIDCPGNKKPDVKTIKDEFNGLFTVVINAISRYVLSDSFDIEEILNDLKIFKVDVKYIKLDMYPRYIVFSGDLSIK